MATEIQEIDLKTDEMIINMGPQHPATHGVLRLLLTLDGETVKHVEPVLGHGRGRTAPGSSTKL